MNKISVHAFVLHVFALSWGEYYGNLKNAVLIRAHLPEECSGHCMQPFNLQELQFWARSCINKA